MSDHAAHIPCVADGGKPSAGHQRWLPLDLHSQVARMVSQVGPGQFELVGFDLMVDQELNVHLIEVNQSPSLSVDGSSVLAVLKPPVVREALALAFEVQQKQSAALPETLGSIVPLSTMSSAVVLIP